MSKAFPTLQSFTKGHPVVMIVVAGLALYWVSFLAWLFPSLTLPVVLCILAGVGVITLWNPFIGTLVVLGEMMTGSFGHWLTLTIQGHAVSIRIAVFIMAMIAGMIAFLVHPSLRKGYRTRLTGILKNNPWIFIALLLIPWGVVRAVLNHNSITRILDDANQWAVITVIFLLSLTDAGHRSRQMMRTTLLGSAGILTFFSFILIFAFTHDPQAIVLPAIFRWTRDTRIGEITTLQASFVRIFLQSHLVLLPIWLACLVRATTQQLPKWGMALWVTTTGVLVASFSRSFTVGLVVASIAIISWLWLQHQRRSALIAPLQLLAVFTGGIIVVGAIGLFPYPPTSNTALGSALVERSMVSDDAAVASRWNLLRPLLHTISLHPVLGSGFGATVQYQSQDPRALASPTHGFITTHAFEWGLLDLWYKFGLLGIAYVFALLYQAWQWLRQGHIAGAFSILCIILVHIFTPYLNHPIGFALLFLLILIHDSDQPMESLLFDRVKTPAVY